MADQNFRQGQSLPNNLITKYVDEGNGSWALQMHAMFDAFSNHVRALLEASPLATTLHRTITALDGKCPPLNSDAQWAANPGGYTKARFFCDIGIRGTTGLTDDPQLTLRPYVRNGGATGYVAAGESVSYVRPRLYDNALIKFQKTVNNRGAYTDYSASVIDNNAATQADLDGLDTVANGDWFIVGGPVPFIGMALDMDAANVNANVSTLTGEYWNGAAWIALTNLVDGTIAVATKTLSGDGQVTWTLPTDWAASTINGITAYWARFSVSAAISANVDVEECDLFFRLRCGIDVQVDGDDVLLMLQTQDNVVSGTIVLAGTVRISWR